MKATAETDVATIRRALEILVEPGSTVELRTLGKFPIWTGYFTDAEALAGAAAWLTKTEPGVYVTINPCNPALIARADNSVVRARSNEATSNNDIVKRRWLPIDIDPSRPGGISATAAEHKAAGDRLVDVYAKLIDVGCPDE